MTTDDREALSRLLDGDLSPEEAALLRERVAREPELAAAWEAMRALPDAIADLPDEAPPPHLAAKILGEAPRRSLPRWPLAVGVAAAAVWLMWPRQPTITLEAGRELIDGDARIVAGPYMVDVDGRAEVIVEPDRPVVRGEGQEADMSIATHLGTAALGAAVTVTVFEGVATLTGPGMHSHALVIHPGETHTVGAAAPSAPGPAPTPAPDPATKAKIDAADPIVQRRIQSLEDEVAQLRFEQAVARGRLEQAEGKPIPFPADLPPGARPEAFEQSVRDAFGADQTIDILGVDCDEFPCLVSLRLREPGENPGELLNERVHALGQSVYAGDTHDAVSLAVDKGGPAFATFAVIPAKGESDMDPDMATRMRWRMEGQMQSAADDDGTP